MFVVQIIVRMYLEKYVLYGILLTTTLQKKLQANIMYLQTVVIFLWQYFLKYLLQGKLWCQMFYCNLDPSYSKSFLIRIGTKQLIDQMFLFRDQQHENAIKQVMTNIGHCVTVPMLTTVSLQKENLVKRIKIARHIMT